MTRQGSHSRIPAAAHGTDREVATDQGVEIDTAGNDVAPVLARPDGQALISLPGAG
jgi:hypothetical protein